VPCCARTPTHDDEAVMNGARHTAQLLLGLFVAAVEVDEVGGGGVVVEFGFGGGF